jgi:putative redox protein
MAHGRGGRRARARERDLTGPAPSFEGVRRRPPAATITSVSNLSTEQAQRVADLETVWVDQIDNTQCLVDVGHRFTFVTDEPVEIGGGGTAVNPFAMLLASLGTCSVGTITGYARAHDIPLDGISIKLSRKLNFVESTGPGDNRELELRIVRIRRDIRVSGPRSQEEVERLREAVARCPVANTLAGAVDIRDCLELADAPLRPGDAA